MRGFKKKSDIKNEQRGIITRFEAVWVRPHPGIMVGSKQVRDDDRVSGDEVTCNTEHSSQC